MRFKNSVNYYGQSAVMDPQGRILIHPAVRERAETHGDVTVLGQQDYLEVWNRTAFEERLAVDPLTDSDLAVLSEFGI
jgi:DNA-binding transcriptional regulator/RsmH inhibitor MraZ